MANVKIELNTAGVRELLRSSEISAACEEQAKKMTLATGVEYVPNVYVGRNRVNAQGVGKESND